MNEAINIPEMIEELLSNTGNLNKLDKVLRNAKKKYNLEKELTTSQRLFIINALRDFDFMQKETIDELKWRAAKEGIKVKKLERLSFAELRVKGAKLTVKSQSAVNVFDLIKDVSALDGQMRKFNDDEIKGKSAEFRDRLYGKGDFLGKQENWEDVLPEAVAVFREALRRKHPGHPLLYDVQMIAGIVVSFGGNLLQQATGEGKTFTTALGAYLLSLRDEAGTGVHCATVNNYLAQRDAEEIGVVFEALSMSVGVLSDDHNGFKIISGTLQKTSRDDVYACDVIYGTSYGYGFDFLQDHLITKVGSKVQRGFFAGILDEADMILIEEANTPLVISNPSGEMADNVRQIYYSIDNIIRSLNKKEDKEKYFAIKQEGDSRSVTLTEAGYDYVAIMLFGASEDNPTIPVRELVDYPELLGMADNA
ncbi:MAG: hypothetical protein KAJ14_12895, partial [Candidatus Omnitrophica bacterium]|nr:hypothetical protein [Candidatus Omnitrophota bacterium]